ncbi:MAG: EAL domain-containing protein, partial [Acetobacteraceae bacterium]|nr:EAL domain-containing protein [Acetobacteraceae bacterium]
VAEAVERGQALAAEARDSLLAAGVAALGLLALAALALAALLRRLVLPVQRLTAATTALAAGDTTAAAPGRSGLAEVDAMARAFAVFRAGALRLSESEARYRLLAENAADMIVQHTADRRRAYVSPASRSLLGREPEEMLAEDFAEILHPDDLEGITTAYDHLMRHGGKITCCYRLRHKDGHYVWVEAHWVATPLDGARTELVAVVRDISERKAAEARIAHMAHHDALTGLPNRVLLRERLHEALARARRGEVFAVLCLDLDHFKAVNDTLGHTVGDTLLRLVTRRLLADARETDTIARLGGDEFAIVQSSVDQPRDATALARRVIEALREPFEIDGHQVVVGASVGIAVAPGDGAEPDELLKNADLALYRAKADGRAAWRFFEPEMDARMQERRLLELDLRRALVAGEFALHYQPLMNPRTRRVVGFEALIRWQHPERGLVSPAEFVPLAEEIGLIGAIGEWVLRRACAEAAGWPGGIKVAVNLSATQLRAGRALADTVAAALKAAGLPAERLELEITETAMLQDTDEVLATLHQIREMGVAIAMDDFGTGYSSLTYLRRFPFERVKIDRSFVQELARERSEGGAIVHAVADLCANLGIATTAEGVETEEQLQRLLTEGLTEVQGYLFSRPVPATEVPGLLAPAETASAP